MNLMTPLMAKPQRSAPFMTNEIRRLEAAGATLRDIARHSVLFLEGDEQEFAYVLVSGWSCCYKLLENGRRQIINFAVPGDFLGLRGLLFRTSDHSFSTISRCRVLQFSRTQYREIFKQNPRIALAVMLAIARDEAIVVEHLVNLGRRSAREGMAHLLIELLYRLRRAGVAAGDTFDCALTQDDLADALGLSSVHVNRVLRDLRELEIVTFQDHKVVIHDLERLSALAGYDSGYLEEPPVELQ